MGKFEGRVIVMDEWKDREPSSELLTVGQVSQWLNVHPNTVRRWDESGLLNSRRVGPRGDRRFLRSEVEKLWTDRSAEILEQMKPKAGGKSWVS